MGFLWAATADDAAGFVVLQSAGDDAYNTSVAWSLLLRQAKSEGLTPLQALRSWVGRTAHPKAGSVSAVQEEAATLEDLERRGATL
ncbi:hypothetical protein [Streptomyces erythrochromogenes]|uniref:hypothetical protein n=1 Tax=Streptomyces erythrochromogenes TaxID=285574 RepID=UPI0036B80C5C